MTNRGGTLLASRRIRSTPFKPRLESLGVSGYTVVNKTILPKGFRHSVEADYWHLREHVQLWDVSCQRHIELHGPDAAALMQWMTPRDFRNAETGQCLYTPLIDANALMVNDPLVLKLDEDRFRLSIADSDVLLWAKGLASGRQMNVSIHDAEVSTLAIQGPHADDVLAQVFGDSIRSLRFFRFRELRFQNKPLFIARAGYSKQGGFEIYIEDAAQALALWDALWSAGEEFNIRPGSPNLIERIEGGLLSLGNDFTHAHNPLECGFDRYCSFDTDLNYLGRNALHAIRDGGPQRRMVGVLFGEAACASCTTIWPVYVDGKPVGEIGSAIYSPRFKKNVALAMMSDGFWHAEQAVSVHCEDGDIVEGRITSLPMPD